MTPEVAEAHWKRHLESRDDARRWRANRRDAFWCFVFSTVAAVCAIIVAVAELT